CTPEPSLQDDWSAAHPQAGQAGLPRGRPGAGEARTRPWPARLQTPTVGLRGLHARLQALHFGPRVSCARLSCLARKARRLATAKPGALYASPGARITRLFASSAKQKALRAKLVSSKRTARSFGSRSSELQLRSSELQAQGKKLRRWSC